MCTATFVPRRSGYLLAMNRDEQLSRVPGLAPRRRILEGRNVLCPSEPGGGTWIVVNDASVSFALVNWYSVATRIKNNIVSRGDVVRAVSALADPELAAERLETLPLSQINPFRLIGIFPAHKIVVEWRWDLHTLAQHDHRWKTQQWISSGFDEPSAQRSRNRVFRVARLQKSAGSLDWLRRLHRSHSPCSGPFSTCMHRSDAATVSYSEVRVSAGHIQMYYHPGPPCIEANSVRDIQWKNDRFVAITSL